MRMPVLFLGHGSPMLAIEENHLTAMFRQIGEQIIAKFGQPKAILAISAHWYQPTLCVASSNNPTQIYDMYGFPQALYEKRYPVKGSPELAHRVVQLLGDAVKVDNSWGIDHGVWSVLSHVFPQANMPVCMLSVSQNLPFQQAYKQLNALKPLREDGYLVIASGNIVHNLAMMNSPDIPAFSHNMHHYIKEAVLNGDDKALIEISSHPDYKLAHPTDEHFLPLLYATALTDTSDIRCAFNDEIRQRTISMCGFHFGLAA